MFPFSSKNKDSEQELLHLNVSEVFTEGLICFRFFRSEDPGCNSSVHSIKLPDVTGQSSWAEHLSAEQPSPCTITKLMQSKAKPVLPMANNSGHNQRLFSYPGNRGRKRLFQLDSPFHKYLFYLLGQRCIEFFRQWLGRIPSQSLCEGCSGLQALVINPTFHRLLWVGRSIFELCHFLHPGLPPEKCRDLAVLPPSSPNLKNRALKVGTKQPFLKKNPHRLFHPCFVFVPCSIVKS